MSDGEQIAETYLTSLIHSHRCKTCQWYPNCSHLQAGDWCLGKQIEIAKKVMGRILELGYVKLADDQSLPDNQYLNYPAQSLRDAWDTAVRIMIATSWRKVEGI